MQSNSTAGFSLLNKYRENPFTDGFYLFKNAGTGQAKYHITKSGCTDSLCGHYGLSSQHCNNKFRPREVDKGMSLQELEDKAGIGKSICKQCLYQWKNNV